MSRLKTSKIHSGYKILPILERIPIEERALKQRLSLATVNSKPEELLLDFVTIMNERTPRGSELWSEEIQRQILECPSMNVNHASPKMRVELFERCLKSPSEWSVILEALVPLVRETAMHMELPKLSRTQFIKALLNFRRLQCRHLFKFFLSHPTLSQTMIPSDYHFAVDFNSKSALYSMVAQFPELLLHKPFLSYLLSHGQQSLHWWFLFRFGRVVDDLSLTHLLDECVRHKKISTLKMCMLDSRSNGILATRPQAKLCATLAVLLNGKEYQYVDTLLGKLKVQITPTIVNKVVSSLHWEVSSHPLLRSKALQQSASSVLNVPRLVRVQRDWKLHTEKLLARQMEILALVESETGWPEIFPLALRWEVLDFLVKESEYTAFCDPPLKLRRKEFRTREGIVHVPAHHRWVVATDRVTE